MYGPIHAKGMLVSAPPPDRAPNQHRIGVDRRQHPFDSPLQRSCYSQRDCAQPTSFPGTIPDYSLTRTAHLTA